MGHIRLKCLMCPCSYERVYRYMLKRKTQAAFGLLLLVNILVLLWSVFGYGITYEINDDVSMAAILAGAYGETSPFIVFGNFIYGSLLELLYRIPENHLNWIVIINYVAMFVAYNAIGYVLIRRNGAWKGSVLFYTFLILFCHETYLTYTFTRVSALTVAAGYYALFYGLTSERRDRKMAALTGIFLVVYGSFVRFMPFLMISAFAAGSWVWKFIRVRKLADDRVRLIKRSIPFFIMGFLVFGGEAFSNHVYQSTPGWEEYLEYNKLRSEVMDYELPDYETYAEEYQSIGLSLNDYYCLKTWNFGDPEVFSGETLKQILMIKGQEKISAVDIRTAFQGVLEWSTAPIGIFVCLLVLYQVLFCKNRSLIVWTVLVCLGEIFYLNLIGRAPARVTFVVYLGAVLHLMSLSEFDDEQKNAFFECVGIVILFGGALLLAQMRLTDSTRKAGYYNNENVIQTIQQLRNTDKLYVWDVTDYDVIFHSYNILNAVNQGISENSVCLGGWMMESPLRNQILENYDVTNSFEALLTDPDVLLAGDKYIGNKWEYLREHYDESANFSIYQRYDKFDIIAFAYNLEDIRQGEAIFDVTSVDMIQDTREDRELLVLQGHTNTRDSKHLWIQLEDSETGEEYTFQVAPVESEKGIDFTLILPRYNMSFGGTITAKLIIEIPDGLFYAAHPYVFSLDTLKQ